MSPEFKPGDTVALKSGGHAMTVSVDEDGWIFCSWIDETGKDHGASFRAAMLTPIIRRAIHIGDDTIRHVWVFADSGQPIADHIAMRFEQDDPQKRAR
jgi:uncharacterized protein YodC (DUF2158 family)